MTTDIHAATLPEITPALLYKHFSPSALNTCGLVRTRWKDGIDIDVVDESLIALMQDYARAALEARDAEIAALSAQSRALRALVHHWKYYGGATNFEQMVESAEKLLEPEARQIRGDGKP